jgi:Dolichyl-phosphate-mannose-protein mannosyltransferase
VWIVSAAYAIPFVDRGWIAHDDGTLAQSAERVLKGELPHRDYDEAYTGGLTAFHALAFEVLGTSLRSLRYAFLLAFLAFVPLVFAIARRALSPWLAAAVTFTCVAWTVPNYFASMPSWYNLFLAALGAWALLRHIESGRLSWIFLAGIAAGLSVLVKIIGLYDVAAVLLFLAWREQTLQSTSEDASRAPRSVAFAALKTALGALFVLLLVLAFRTRSEAVDVLHFVVPGAAVAALLVLSEWRDGRGRFGRRMAGLARLVLPFAAGLAIPIGAFVARYAAAGSLQALWEGVFVRPQRQIATASLGFPGAWTLLAAVPFAALLAFPRLATGRARSIALRAAVAAALVGLLALGQTLDGYRWIWNSARSLDVVAVLVGCWRLWRDEPPLGARRRQQIFLLLALTACIGLVQYPFSSPIYFCYAVPFTVLTIAFLVASEPVVSGQAGVGWLHACVLVFYLGFALLWMNPGYVFFLGGAAMRYHADGFLNLPRGGIRIGATEARAYNDLVAAVEEKARGSEIFAGPEAPEVYFLCDKPNLTRILFEGVSGIRPGSKNTERLRPVFDRADVKVVVWNRSPEFTHGLWRVYREQLWARFPHSKEIGKYTVMWRD